MTKAIGWWTPPVGVGVGYGYTAVSMIEALQRKGVKVWYDGREQKVHVSFVQPQMYRGSNEQFRVGFTPWESTEIPESWVQIMQGMDEIWTTSEFCKEVFESYNVNDVIRNVPHGIDQEVWKITDRFVGGKFRFLHVGGPTERKGGQKVVDAFIELFGGNDDYELILKTNGPSEARWYKDGKYMGNIRSHPQIKVIEQKLDTEDLYAVYARSHCMVYPTNGEGFGCIPFQAIATGMPTIVTNATGCTEYAEMSMPLNSTPTTGVGIHLGMWVEPDVDHMKELMLHVTENYNDEKVKAMHSANIIHNTRTWDHVADQILEILGDKVEQLAI